MEPPPKRTATEAALFKQQVQSHFFALVQKGLSPNEAAVKALELAKEEAVNAAVTSEPSTTAETQPEANVSSSPSGSSESVVDTGVQEDVEKTTAAQDLSLMSLGSGDGYAKYGPLCLGLAGPFQSICVVGWPRPNKKLLVLDVDHTIYDPSNYRGVKASVVRSDDGGLFDESLADRCRPGLHDFLTESYKEYDIMVWSASDMKRILTLLHQLGICGAGHSDYRLLAVLDIDSMSEAVSTDTLAEDMDVESNKGALVQTITVPAGAVAGQLIEAKSIADGKTMVVTVPAGLREGDRFHVTPPGALSNAISSMGEDCDIDASELELALQMSMTSQEASPSCDSGVEATPVVPMQKARKRSKYIKPLSLIWACSEFSDLYNEKNTVIIDDTLDVCGANPHNFIQCSRYEWRDHATDQELPRLAKYISKIAQMPAFPSSHDRWRENV